MSFNYFLSPSPQIYLYRPRIYSWKKIILIIFILSSITAHAQITSGKITYERRTNLYKSLKRFEDVKEWISEKNKNKIDVFELTFNDSLSLFKLQETDIVDHMSWATTKNTVYQNHNTKQRITDKNLWSEHFLVSDSLKKITWKITDDKRNIAGYLCRKAIWQANDSIKIYAWFCSEINPSIGPESIVGLPGAILGVATEDGGIVYFAKTVELTQQDIKQLLLPKTKQKIYQASELKAQLEKEHGKNKWGKALIYNNFGIW